MVKYIKMNLNSLQSYDGPIPILLDPTRLGGGAKNCNFIFISNFFAWGWGSLETLVNYTTKQYSRTATLILAVK